MRRRGARAAWRYALAVIAHLALVTAWLLLVKVGHVPRFVLPSPLDTAAALATAATTGGQHRHHATDLRRLFPGRAVGWRWPAVQLSALLNRSCALLCH